MKSEIEVPDGWKDMPLGEILNVGTGKKNVQDSIENGKYPFFTRSVETQRINSWSYDCEGLFIAGEGNFSVRYYKGKFELHQRCYLLSALNGKSISMKFLQNAIQIKINNLIRTAVKSTVISLRKPIIENLKILLPPLPEQQKIADILSKVDEQINLTEKIIDKTEELKKGLTGKLFSKGIKKGKLKEIKVKYSPKNWSIPESWTVIQFNKLTTKITDGTHKTPNYIKTGVPFLRVTDIQSNEIDWKNVKYISEEEHSLLIKRCKPEKGDILLSKNGTIGILKIIDWDKEFSIFVSLCLIKVNKTTIDTKYLYHILTSNIIFNQYNLRSKTGTVTNLHLEEIRELNIPVPPMEEQKQIASILSKVDEHIQDNKKELKHLQELKKGLMQDLLTGKVRVSV